MRPLPLHKHYTSTCPSFLRTAEAVSPAADMKMAEKRDLEVFNILSLDKGLHKISIEVLRCPKVRDDNVPLYIPLAIFDGSS